MSYLPSPAAGSELWWIIYCLKLTSLSPQSHQLPGALCLTSSFIHSFESWGPLGWAMRGKGPGQEMSRLRPPQRFGESTGLAPGWSAGPGEPWGQSMQLWPVGRGHSRPPDFTTHSRFNEDRGKLQPEEKAEVVLGQPGRLEMEVVGSGAQVGSGSGCGVGPTSSPVGRRVPTLPAVGTRWGTGGCGQTRLPVLPRDLAGTTQV